MKADGVRANRDADGLDDAIRAFLTAVAHAVARRAIQKQAEETERKRGEKNGQPKKSL